MVPEGLWRQSDKLISGGGGGGVSTEASHALPELVRGVIIFFLAVARKKKLIKIKKCAAWGAA
jgi:hypothetical protein